MTNRLAFLVVWTDQCVFNTHRPIANQIRIQIVPSVDRPLGIKNVYDKEEVLNVHPVVVGGGTDGASVNIGQHSSIKEEMQ